MQVPFSWRVAAVALALSMAPARAQGPTPAPGFRLFGPLYSTSTYLMDLNGALVHTWPSAWLPGVGITLARDGSLLRAIKVGELPEVIGGTGGGVERIDFDGVVTWQFLYAGNGVMSHHDIEELPNGNLLMIAWEDKTPAQAIQAGRNPALINGATFRPDHLIEVQPTGPSSGQIVWQWHLWDHLVQDFDPSKANYGVVGSHPELLDINFPADANNVHDWNHVNSVKYDAVHDWIVISAPRQNEVYVIDHGTTTAEAAGHTGGAYGRGGDILYRWGNPQAYRAGTAADQRLFFQHAAHVIPAGRPGAGNLMVFNNQSPGGSSILELVLPLDASNHFVLAPGAAYGPAAPVWSYAATGFNSPLASNAERLPNGNTLICSSTQSRIFEVSPAGAVAWTVDLLAPFSLGLFHVHYVDRALWANETTLSASAGGTIRFDVVAGSPNAYGYRMLAGSASGTSPGFPYGGLTVPLNYDVWTAFTLDFGNTPLLQNSQGFLGIHGESRSTLSVPAAALPPQAVGVRFDFAALVFNLATASPSLASNPVGFVIVP